jgi:4-amino-4-deoxy-L-arabinose transferase-like glycosyltransferase
VNKFSSTDSDQGWSTRVERIAQRTDRYGWVLFCVLAIVYLIATVKLAGIKLLWTDEFFTLYLSRLAPSELWRALLTGGDQHPPPFFLLHRFVITVFGEHPWSLRLPAMLGFLLMLICIYRFVTVRTAPLYGLAATLVPLITVAHEYSYEARGYGLLAGFLSLAAVCWQRAGETKKNTVLAIGIAVALIAAVASHYYAILLLPALAAAEAIRGYRTRSVNWRVWLAICAPIIPLAVFFPLLRSSSGFASTFWAKPSVLEINLFYKNVLGEAAAGLLCGLVVAGLYRTLFQKKTAAVENSQEIPPEEILLAAGFAAVPFFVYMLAKFVTGAFAWRYAIGGICGIAILFGFFCFKLFRGSRTAGCLFIVVTGSYFILATQLTGQRLERERRELFYVRSYLDSNVPDSQPLIIGDSKWFYALTYYARPGKTLRYIYLADPQRSVKYVHHDTVERSLLALNPWFKLNVNSYDSFFAHNNNAMVWSGVSGKWSWLPSALIDDGRNITLNGRVAEGLLMSVRTGGPEKSAVSLPSEKDSSSPPAAGR